ncbi:dinb family protein [Flammeovirgaceae bacterium 311]|nr:dinb family protein [Flammeovirgaceae bacterium 311]
MSSFLRYYERIRYRTNQVINVVPPEQLDWTYKAGKFTLADLIRHIAAIERDLYAETLLGRPSRYRGCGKELADGYEGVLQYFHSMHNESVAIFQSIGDEGLERKCRLPTGGEISAWKWLLALTEHEIHHRGQLYLYLGMLGVSTPPIFGLSAEQLQKVSRT